ncbi:hypothetical protein ACGFNP_37310 [Nonomuraea sp. NPDC049269]|uniref:hypothetical protein n=1 Tax=Nonomuraea sp. NPDC049269 TaxID=3364349 RepID=UPI0037199AF0
MLMLAEAKNRPAPGTIDVCDKGFAGADFECTLLTEFGITVVRGQLGLDQHGARILSGLWTRVIQRLLALNVAIWFNWKIGTPRKRSLIAYDH